MPAIVDLCNMALNRTGTTQSIASLDEASKEARLCTRWYPVCRDYVLADMPWPFATRQVTLALATEAAWEPWAYRYQLPADLVLAQAIDDGSVILHVEQRIPFEIIDKGDGTGRHLLTDQPNAVLRYNGRVVDPNQYPPGFIDCLTWRLAQELVLPLALGINLLERLAANYQAALEIARGHVLRERQARPPAPSEFARARL